MCVLYMYLWMCICVCLQICVCKYLRIWKHLDFTPTVGGAFLDASGDSLKMCPGNRQQHEEPVNVDKQVMMRLHQHKQKCRGGTLVK